MNRAALLHPDVVEEPITTIADGGDVPHLRRRELEEVTQILGEDGGDGTEGGGADDGQLGPAEEKGRERPEPLEQVGEDPARPWERRRQLGQGQGAEERDGPARRPRRRTTGPGSWSRSATPAGTRKMPLPMVEPTRTAIALQRPRWRGSRSPQASADVVMAWLNIALTRACRAPFFPA